jgi:hypothetical protein
MFQNPVLVVGDVMLDRHVHGQVRRISPEAPVPVVSLMGEIPRGSNSSRSWPPRESSDSPSSAIQS